MVAPEPRRDKREAGENKGECAIVVSASGKSDGTGDAKPKSARTAK